MTDTVQYSIAHVPSIHILTETCRAASQAAVMLTISVAVGRIVTSADVSVWRACCEFGMTACSIIEASALVVLVK